MTIPCERCGQPIEDGSPVELIGGTLDEGARILRGDVLIVHVTCPTPSAPDE